jgi:hypothetical protein
VAVEKLCFPKKSRKSGDTKCPGDWGKSFVELPDTKQFLRNRSERVFQQPPLFSTPILDLVALLTGKSGNRKSNRLFQRAHLYASQPARVKNRVGWPSIKIQPRPKKSPAGAA